MSLPLSELQRNCPFLFSTVEDVTIEEFSFVLSDLSSVLFLDSFGNPELIAGEDKACTAFSFSSTTNVITCQSGFDAFHSLVIPFGKKLR